MQIELRDDRTYYAQGFWYKVLNGQCQIRIYLSEGGTDKFYAFCQPQEEATHWSEWAIKDGVHIRTCQATIISVAKAMIDTPTVDWIAEIQAHQVASGESIPTMFWSMVSFKDIFASLLKASGLNATFSSDDVTFVYDIQDILYKYDGTTYGPNDLFAIVTSNVDGSSPFTIYFSASSPMSTGKEWATNFATAGQLLSLLLFNLGFALHMDYDTGTERHLMKLVQRGHAYPDANDLVFTSREKASDLAKSTALNGDAVVMREYNSERYVWRSKKFNNEFSIFGPKAAPDYVKFDIDKQLIFDCNPITDPGDSHPMYVKVAENNYKPIDAIQYWNYATGEYDSPASPTDLAEAVCGYYFWRFTTKFSQVVRLYRRMTASDGVTESFTNINIMRRTVIDLDGEGNVKYMLNKATKKPMTAECEAEWVKE
jgi:hypothetical protein